MQRMRKGSTYLQSGVKDRPLHLWMLASWLVVFFVCISLVIVGLNKEEGTPQTTGQYANTAASPVDLHYTDFHDGAFFQHGSTRYFGPSFVL